jgi:hypothetical protein
MHRNHSLGTGRLGGLKVGEPRNIRVLPTIHPSSRQAEGEVVQDRAPAHQLDRGPEVQATWPRKLEPAKNVLGDHLTPPGPNSRHTSITLVAWKEGEGSDSGPHGHLGLSHGLITCNLIGQIRISAKVVKSGGCASLFKTERKTTFQVEVCKANNLVCYGTGLPVTVVMNCPAPPKPPGPRAMRNTLTCSDTRMDSEMRSAARASL